MNHSKKNTYLFSFDFLRVMAILGVILIHQTTTTLQVLNHNIFDLPVTLFLNQTSRYAVPMLFLISGFVLELNSKESFTYLTYFKKRASRILLPYLFWSVLYFSLWQGFSINNLLDLRFLKHLADGTSSYHLYFIPTLIIFYITFPIFHRFIHIIKNPFFLTFIFIIQIGIAFYNYYFKLIPVQEDLRVALLTFSLFVIGIGAVHHQKKIIQFVEERFKIIVSFLFLLIIGIYVHVFNLTAKLSTTSFIYNQYGPLNYFYTLFLALCVIHITEKRHYIKKLVITLSRLSFFVFFIHVLVLQNFWNLYLSGLDSGIYKSVFFDLAVTMLVAAFCFIIALAFHKIPYATKITG